MDQRHITLLLQFRETDFEQLRDNILHLVEIIFPAMTRNISLSGISLPHFKNHDLADFALKSKLGATTKSRRRCRRRVAGSSYRRRKAPGQIRAV